MDVQGECPTATHNFKLGGLAKSQGVQTLVFLNVCSVVIEDKVQSTSRKMQFFDMHHFHLKHLKHDTQPNFASEQYVVIMVLL